MTVSELSSALLGENVQVSKHDWELEVSSTLQRFLPVKLHGKAGSPAFFLTGVTGLVGIHLLAALLEATTWPIVCLVRANNCDAGMDRVRAAMLSHGLNAEVCEKRVQIVVGALDKPHLGLSSRAEFEQLAASYDFCIIHNGAVVNQTKTKHHFFFLFVCLFFFFFFKKKTSR